MVTLQVYPALSQAFIAYGKWQPTALLLELQSTEVERVVWWWKFAEGEQINLRDEV